MSWNPAEFRKKLAKSLESFDWEGSDALCRELIAHLSERSKADPYPAEEARRILQMLRKKRRFASMQNVAEALIENVDDALQIRRQYAQSLIDAGNTTNALLKLESLIEDTEGDPSENAEARGLRGRVYKQLYINTNNPASKWSRDNLDQAVRCYLEVYNLEPGKHLWPGINVTALLLRARRDGIALDGYPDPLELARDILNKVEEKDADSEAKQWDYATAAEACVALDKPEDAFKWISKYIRAEYAEAFQDNLLLGHKDPRVHYRTPTEGGSSGSPVFNRQWTLIALHHAGSQALTKLDGSGKYPANEGIWIGAIIKAIAGEAAQA